MQAPSSRPAPGRHCTGCPARGPWPVPEGGPTAAHPRSPSQAHPPPRGGLFAAVAGPAGLRSRNSRCSTAPPGRGCSACRPGPRSAARRCSSSAQSFPHPASHRHHLAAAQRGSWMSSRWPGFLHARAPAKAPASCCIALPRVRHCPGSRAQSWRAPESRQGQGPPCWPHEWFDARLPSRWEPGPSARLNRTPLATPTLNQRQ